jgi:hypothetical protein
MVPASAPSTSSSRFPNRHRSNRALAVFAARDHCRWRRHTSRQFCAVALEEPTSSPPKLSFVVAPVFTCAWRYLLTTSSKGSVALPRTDWAARFRSVLERAEVEINAGTDDSTTDGADVFARANARLVELANSRADRPPAALVWDGGRGDRPGGTADLVRRLGFRRPDPRACVIDPTPRDYEERQSSPGPKRMLALDGGGIRGVALRRESVGRGAGRLWVHVRPRPKAPAQARCRRRDPAAAGSRPRGRRTDQLRSRLRRVWLVESRQRNGARRGTGAARNRSVGHRSARQTRSTSATKRVRPTPLPAAPCR